MAGLVPLRRLTILPAMTRAPTARSAARAPAAPPAGKPAQAKPPALGPRLHAIRKARGLTLDELSERSGISKSMLSQIERGQANPTFGTLWNITQSLGLELSELVEAGARKPAAAIERLAANLTPTINSKDGTCVLRILSPGGTAGQMEWYELAIEPGGRLESEPHGAGAMEHLSCLAGRLTVRSEGATQDLAAGDTVRYRGDAAHAILNPGRQPARALLVVITGGGR